jgi:hypothetical protein
MSQELTRFVGMFTTLLAIISPFEALPVFSSFFSLELCPSVPGAANGSVKRNEEIAFIPLRC